MKTYYNLLLSNINEKIAENLPVVFECWLQRELDKRLCKTRGKLFKFNIALDKEGAFYSIHFGSLDMVLIGNDATQHEKRVVFQKGAEAIMKCKQIANDFVEKNGLKIVSEPYPGVAVCYTVCRKN